MLYVYNTSLDFIDTYGEEEEREELLDYIREHDDLELMEEDQVRETLYEKFADEWEGMSLFDKINELSTLDITEEFDNIFVNDEDTFNSTLDHLTPMDIALKVSYGSYSTYDEFFGFDGYDNLVSFDSRELGEELDNYQEEWIEDRIENEL